MNLRIAFIALSIACGLFTGTITGAQVIGGVEVTKINGVEVTKEAFRINGRPFWGFRVDAVSRGSLVAAGLQKNDIVLANDWQVLVEAMSYVDQMTGSEHPAALDSILAPKSLTVVRKHVDGSQTTLYLGVYPQDEAAYAKAAEAWAALAQEEAPVGSASSVRDASAYETVLLGLAALVAVGLVRDANRHEAYMSHPVVKSAISGKSSDPETYAKYCLQEVPIFVDVDNVATGGLFGCSNTATEMVWMDICTGERESPLNDCGPAFGFDYPSLPN